VVRAYSMQMLLRISPPYTRFVILAPRVDGRISMGETGLISPWGIRLRLWWLGHF